MINSDAVASLLRLAKIKFRRLIRTCPNPNARPSESNVRATAQWILHRQRIIDLAARYRLPAVYWDRRFVKDGGLMYYADNRDERGRQAARYVDRILKGERPSDLPVQAPTKFEYVINLQTARALGIEVPPAVLSIADELIE
jgi:putative ABC transport system substrate-binding protein